MAKIKSIRRFLGSMMVAVALSVTGCVLLAVPVAIKYYQSTREYVATAEIGMDAEAVYRTAVKEAQARSSRNRSQPKRRKAARNNRRQPDRFSQGGAAGQR